LAVRSQAIRKLDVLQQRVAANGGTAFADRLLPRDVTLVQIDRGEGGVGWLHHGDAVQAAPPATRGELVRVLDGDVLVRAVVLTDAFDRDAVLRSYEQITGRHIERRAAPIRTARGGWTLQRAFQ